MKTPWTGPGSMISRRTALLIGACAGLGLLLAIARPAVFLAGVWLREDQAALADPPAGREDASGLEENIPHEVVAVAADPAQAERQLVDLVARAHREGLKISISGAKHTMGGHTLYPGGIALDMLPFRRMSLDEKTATLTVAAGARWADVIPFLDARGFSVAVMQSNNDFSVGGSVSANCHGWQPDSAPIASTVESFRLLLADGAIRVCSRTQNRELFSLALGGYGLFGIILDVRLHVVPNEIYSSDLCPVTPENYAATYARFAAGDPAVGLAYGRISVAPGQFLQDAFIAVFRKQTPPVVAHRVFAPDSPGLLERLIFRGSVGSDYGKHLCWALESAWGEKPLGARSRNAIMNEPSDWYANRDPASTDILHEYFVPRDRLATFIASIRPALLRSKVDLLNITVRAVKADADTVLSYAPGDRFALVLYFHQQKDAAADLRMEHLTRELIDAALACGGSYYLPYRPHATLAQFQNAYPKSESFFEAKQKYDPDSIFENQFYRRYGEPLLMKSAPPVSPPTSPPPSQP